MTCSTHLSDAVCVVGVEEVNAMRVEEEEETDDLVCDEEEG